MDEELREDEILMNAALRFDGYGYRDEPGFDWNAWTPERYAADGDELEPLEACALFFSLQRYLCKWGGGREPRDGTYWWMYRELFLRTCETPIPPRFRFKRYPRWPNDDPEAIRERKRLVRRVHEETDYE